MALWRAFRDLETGFCDRHRCRERRARDALAIGAVAIVGKQRRGGDGVFNFATLAAPGLRKGWHRNNPTECCEQ